MTDLLKATYADLKTVKTRSSLQIILEMPIEALTDVVALLGAPVPGNEVWVAVARLRTGAAQAAIEPPAVELPKFGKLAQQAGILCNEPAFQSFAENRGYYGRTPEVAADFVRYECGVKSRADLDKDEQAGRKFLDLRASYKVWMTGIAA